MMPLSYCLCAFQYYTISRETIKSIMVKNKTQQRANTLRHGSGTRYDKISGNENSNNREYSIIFIYEDYFCFSFYSMLE